MSLQVQYLHSLLSLAAGDDYTSLMNIPLTFTSTSLQRLCVNIGIIDDLAVEPTEQFSVQIDQSTSQGSVSTQAGVLIVDGIYTTLLLITLSSAAQQIKFLSFASIDDDVIVSFELATYSANEGQATAEACAVSSTTPIPGQSVSVLVSTEDGTAIGMKNFSFHRYKFMCSIFLFLWSNYK